MSLTKSIVKNTIKNVYKNNIFSLTPEGPKSDQFLFVVPFSILKSQYDNISQIQVICQNKNAFDKKFKNSLFNKTKNLKKYIPNNFSNDVLENESRKSIFLDYNTSNRNSDLFTENFIFKKENFNSNLNNLFAKNEDSNNETYLLNLGSTFSKSIFSNKINAIRVVLLDEKKSIIDNSDFIFVDFDFIKKKRSVINKKIFYQEITRNFAKNSVIYFRDGSFFIKPGGVLDTNNFSRLDINISYMSGDNVYTISKSISSLDVFEYKFNDLSLKSFLSNIAFDFLTNKQKFNFEIQYEIFYKDNDNFDKHNSLFLSKSLDYLKSDSLLINIFNFSKGLVIGKIKRSLSFSLSSEIVNSKIQSILKINTIDNKEILNFVKINKIFKNNKGLDFYYKNQNFSIENKVNYIGKSINQLFGNQKQLNFWVNKSSRKSFFKIEFEISGVIFAINFKNKAVISKETYESLINQTNVLFKKNMQSSNIKLNIDLDESNRSIFSYDNFSLINIEEFNDIALNFGYIDSNSQGDIQAFLENCIVKIENLTKLNITDSEVYKTNYFFLKSLFETNSVNQDLISIRRNFIVDYIQTNDYFHFINTRKNTNNTNILDFFLEKNNSNSYKKLLNVSNLKAENELIFKILPVPFAISSNKGRGFDSLNNPINERFNNQISEDERNIVSLELINYFYSGNSNLNWDKFNKFLITFFDSNLSSNSVNYAELFNELFSLNVEENSIYKIKEEYDADTILEYINIDRQITELHVLTNSFEENIYNKFFNFANENNEFFFKEFPLTAKFEEINYNSNLRKSTFRDLIILNDINKELKIDISFLQGLYSDSRIAEIAPKIRTSIFFLMTNEEKQINAQTENTEYSIKNISGDEYITYNKDYFTNENRSSNFSDFNSCIDSAIINVNLDDFEIVIDSDSLSLNLNNIQISPYNSFFEFCKSINVDLLDKILLRTSVSFSILDNQNNKDYITAVFNNDISSINLNDQVVSINNIEKLSSIIVT